MDSITLPSTITEIPHDAIQECTNLREIVMHNEGMKITKNKQGVDIEAKKVFSRCPSFTYISFPSLLNSRLEDIVLAGQTQARNKVNDIPGVQIRDSKISISATLVESLSQDYRTQLHLDWSAVRKKRDMILELILFYERKEATCLFELALWKSQITIAEDNQNPVDRQACRIDVPGPVKDAILQYL